MKKILTVAIAAAIAVPMASTAADTTLYGKINNSVVHTDAVGTAANWDVKDNASRVGIKASEDLGNGMTALLQFEFKADSDTASGIYGGRLGYVGLSGGFGTVLLGQQWGPYYGAVDKTDIFSLPGVNNHYLAGSFRHSDVLAYASPNFGGVSVTVGAIAGAGGETGVDVWTGAVNYSNAGLSVGLAFIENQTTSTNDMLGLGVKYAMGDFAVIGQYERQDNATDDNAWAIGGTANFGNNVAKLVYGNKEVGAADESGWGVGLDHNFTKRTKVFVEYHNSEIGVNTDNFGVGMQHVF
ncbi:MAG: porin [Sedimenticola sp.]